MGLATRFEPVLRRFGRRVPAVLRRYPWLQTVAIVLASGIIYGIGFRLSISIFLRGNLSVCWPLVGLQTAVFLRIPRRYWLTMLIGMMLSQIILAWAQPADEIVADVIGDVGEVLIAAFALPPVRKISDWIMQPNLLKRFMICAVILGPAITAYPAAAAYSHELHISFWENWARWFLGDMLGNVIWLPLGIVLMSREAYALLAWKALPRTAGLMGTLSLAGCGIFFSKPTSSAFMLMPLLLIIALELGFSGSVIAVNILSVISSKGTLQHLGPFGLIQDPYSVTMLQVYLTFSMLMCFPISVILLERDNFEREIKDAYRAMELLATRDGLTGLANRRRFDTVLQEEWHRALHEREPIAIIMIDVDCFKRYNDVYGHVAGDDCLRRIADSIKEAAKRGGDLPARFGGEEFVVLLSRTDLSGVIEVAEKVRLHIELMDLEHKGNPHQIVTVSIGCWSMIPVPEIRPEFLIEAADRGLYLAKQGGRNRVATLETVLHAPVTFPQVLAKRA